MGTANGIEVSPDGKTLYVNESVQRNIWAYDIGADGALTGKRLLQRFDDFRHGRHARRRGWEFVRDALQQGHGGQAVTAGQAAARDCRAGRQPSNISFGGPDGRTAYVTEVVQGRLLQFRVNPRGWSGKGGRSARRIRWPSNRSARNDALLLQALKQLEERLRRILVIEKTRLAALAHVGHHFHRPAKIGVRMPP